MATQLAMRAPCCQSRSFASPSPKQQRSHLQIHQQTVPSLQKGFYGSCLALTAPRHRRGFQAPGRGLLQIRASVFGVGAPEALVVGVVALVVFGPRGLAEAVKSLGATLKTFQPTIREVLGVTQDLRNTLEEQIGLDDIRRELRGGTSTPPSWSQTNQFKPTDSYQWDKERTDSSNGSSSSSSSSSGRDATADSSSPSRDAEAAQTSSRPHAADEDLDSMRKQSASAAWGAPGPPQQQQNESSPSSAGGGEALSGLTLEDLEAELRRRKAAKQEVQKT